MAMPFWLKSPDLGFVCVEKTLDPLFAVMAAIYPSSSPMACDTVASFSVLEEAFSVGDDYLLLDTPASLSAHPVDQEETQPFAPSLVGPDVNMTREDIEAQLNEFQDTVSRLGLGRSTRDPRRRTDRVAAGTEGAGQPAPLQDPGE